MGGLGSVRAPRKLAQGHIDRRNCLSMYETETNCKVESAEEIPAGVLAAFGELKGRIRERTILPWSEHCTECVWPTCYSSCGLYSARQDGRCRRFVDGMVRIESASAANSYVLKIRFKRWGKLWTPGNVRLYSAKQAATLERREFWIGNTIQRLPLPSLVKVTAGSQRYGFKKRVAEAPSAALRLPTCFLLECYNPDRQDIRLSLVMRAVDENSRMPFQKLIRLAPGFHRVRVPLEEISPLVDVRRPFGIELVPNEEENEETTLYFGVMDFVVEAAEQNPKTEGKDTKKVKCVVWDLDNTLWNGLLVEDGWEHLRLRADIAEIIATLDQRGILHSIASKNNPEEAVAALKKFGLDQYFLYPQISWGPKSQAIKAIAQQLNIGLDSILFVDDSPFERAEVQSICPEVRVLDAEQYGTLAEREVCRVPITEESRERRKLYQVEASRQAVAQNFSSDYMAFLQHCQIQLTVRPMTEGNLERVYELTQRTNQMNFSGNRYERETLRRLLDNSHLDTFVLSCEDRFGSYGVIGFCIVDRREPLMTDLMFSCRAQSKRVEHAFLAAVIRRYIDETGNDFYANYRKTPRNAQSGRVFDHLTMEQVENRDGVLSLRFRKEWAVPDDGVIEVVMHDATPVLEA
jgi:FkbH-like protein